MPIHKDILYETSYEPVVLYNKTKKTGSAGETPLPQPLIQASSNCVILLAEDNPSNAEIILDYLEANGYQTIWARNGKEAVRQALMNNPGLILMDMQMPELDGLDAIRIIRAEDHITATPIIALTALAMPGDKERCLQVGADAYLSKPISLRQLLKVINRLMHS